MFVLVSCSGAGCESLLTGRIGAKNVLCSVFKQAPVVLHCES